MFHLRSHCCQFLVKNGWPGSITRRASLYLDRNWWTPTFGRLLSEGISMGFNIKKGENEYCRRVRRCEVRISWPNLFREPGDRPFSSPYWTPPPPPPHKIYWTHHTNSRTKGEGLKRPRCSVFVIILEFWWKISHWGAITKHASEYLNRNRWTPNFGRTLKKCIETAWKKKKKKKRCFRRLRRC